MVISGGRRALPADDRHPRTWRDPASVRATFRPLLCALSLMGLSQAAPFYAAIEGLKAGETAEFRGRAFDIRAIY